MNTRHLQIRVGERVGIVDAILLEPPEPRAVYAFAHGAGDTIGKSIFSIMGF